ncbi:MAG: hypothetical protein ACE15C_12150 [Phycisphaerae bacterium]
MKDGSRPTPPSPLSTPFEAGFRVEDFLAFPQPTQEQAAMVAAIRRGRLMENARFEVPISLYLGFLRSKGQPVVTAPVARDPRVE